MFVPGHSVGGGHSLDPELTLEADIVTHHDLVVTRLTWDDGWRLWTLVPDTLGLDGVVDTPVLVDQSTRVLSVIRLTRILTQKT